MILSKNVKTALHIMRCKIIIINWKLKDPYVGGNLQFHRKGIIGKEMFNLVFEMNIYDEKGELLQWIYRKCTYVSLE